LGAAALLSCIHFGFFGFIFKTFVVTTRDTGKKLLLQFFTFVLIYLFARKIASGAKWGKRYAKTTNKIIRTRMSYVSWINMHGIRRWPRVLSATFVIFLWKKRKTED